jgi:hypothetical protein
MRPDLALVGAATPRDATLVAASDAASRTPPPQTTSANRRLKHFTERVTKARQTPLLELPGVDTAHAGRTPPALPKRSRRIAAHSISHIPTPKWGEHLVLKRLGLTSGMSSPSTSVLKAYDEINGGDPGNIQALHELIPLDGTWVHTAASPPCGSQGIGPLVGTTSWVDQYPM